MRVALYARVSTSDKDQNPETQVMPMREFCLAQGWQIAGEYVDHAPANDLAHRVQSRQLLDDAAKRRFSLVLVFKPRPGLPQRQAHARYSRRLGGGGVSFRSIREQFDTSTALGRLLLNPNPPMDRDGRGEDSGRG